jgi:hypothetical protein
MISNEQYFCCMVVCSMKPPSSSAAVPTTAAAGTTGGAQIYITQEPFKLIEDLDGSSSSSSSSSSNGMMRKLFFVDLSRLIPVVKDTATTLLPSRQHAAAAAAAASAIQCSTLGSRNVEWMERTVFAIHSAESAELANALDRGACEVQSAPERLEVIKKRQLEDTVGSSAAAAVPTSAVASSRLFTSYSLPTSIQQQQHPHQVQSSLNQNQNSFHYASVEHERKRRRRKLHKRTGVTTNNRLATTTTSTTFSAGNSHRKLGMILGPMMTFEAARFVGVIWGLLSRGTLSSGGGGLGVVLAERFSLDLYVDFCILLRCERLVHHRLYHANNGELWLVLRKRLGELKRTLHVLPVLNDATSDSSSSSEDSDYESSSSSDVDDKSSLPDKRRRQKKS